MVEKKYGIMNLQKYKRKERLSKESFFFLEEKKWKILGLKQDRNN